MAQMRAYVPGSPNWVDVSSPNVDVSIAFYRDLFGWEVIDAVPEGGDAGGYRMFRLGEHLVAGIGPIQDGGAPPAWTTYVASADADATADAIRSAGGTVLMDPFPISDVGRTLAGADPTGAVFSVWEAGQHIGAGLVHEPGTFSWNELQTHDPATAAAFYTEVFGWDVRARDTGAGRRSTEFLVDGRPVGGVVDLRGRAVDEVPAHWLTWFAVVDTDAAVRRVEELGGEVMVPATDIDEGRVAVVTDRFGASFAVMTAREPA